MPILVFKLPFRLISNAHKLLFNSTKNDFHGTLAPKMTTNKEEDAQHRQTNVKSLKLL